MKVYDNKRMSQQDFFDMEITGTFTLKNPLLRDAKSGRFLPGSNARVNPLVRDTFKHLLASQCMSFMYTYAKYTPSLTGNVRSQINTAMSELAGEHGISSLQVDTRMTGRGQFQKPPKSYQYKLYAQKWRVRENVYIQSRSEWADVENATRGQSGEVTARLKFRGGANWYKGDFIFNPDIEYWEYWDAQYDIMDYVAEITLRKFEMQTERVVNKVTTWLFADVANQRGYIVELDGGSLDFDMSEDDAPFEM